MVIAWPSQVRLPNVIGMALLADGVVAEPYPYSGAYINNMSDSSGSCRFDPNLPAVLERALEVLARLDEGRL